MWPYCQHCGSPEMCDACHETFYDDRDPVGDNKVVLSSDVSNEVPEVRSPNLLDLVRETASQPATTEKELAHYVCQDCC